LTFEKGKGPLRGNRSHEFRVRTNVGYGLSKWVFPARFPRGKGEARREKTLGKEGRKELSKRKYIIRGE